MNVPYESWSNSVTSQKWVNDNPTKGLIPNLNLDITYSGKLSFPASFLTSLGVLPYSYCKKQ
jgi:hypothetical protein